MEANKIVCSELQTFGGSRRNSNFFLKSLANRSFCYLFYVLLPTSASACDLTRSPWLDNIQINV
jgi:hypothetical protein